MGHTTTYSRPFHPPGHRFFTIGETNGQIRTSKPLDYETEKEHILLVTATDSGNDQRATVVPVTINVVDVEDVVPIFPKRLYLAQVPENEVNYLVATLEVGTAKIGQ